MRQVYESFLARFQETTQQLEFQKADARVITEALPALAPSRPRKKLVLAVAIVAGAVLGVAASLVHEAMNWTVRSAGDLARVTNLPVLSSLPRVRRRGKTAAWQAAEPAAEALALCRGTAAAARRADEHSSDAKPRVILFTGAGPGVGASSTALGFGRVMTVIGAKAVLVDANLRRPASCTLLDIADESPQSLDHLQGRVISTRPSSATPRAA